jgi:hypothetical protein
VNVRNEDGDYVTTKVAIKQLCYIPITSIMKWLFLSEETEKQMRWHMEEKRETEDPDIMSQHADSEAWHTLYCFDPKFARDTWVFVLVCRWMVSNLTAMIGIHTLAE